MAPEDFRFLTRLLRRRSGLALSPNKRALTKSRLAPLVRRFGFKDEAGLIQDLRLGREALADAVVEAMTVQESGFFREAAQFGALRSHVLPRLLKARQKDRKGEKKLRIWSDVPRTKIVNLSLITSVNNCWMCQTSSFDLKS